mgnify:CR=1 FL=1
MDFKDKGRIIKSFAPILSVVLVTACVTILIVVCTYTVLFSMIRAGNLKLAGYAAGLALLIVKIVSRDARHAPENVRQASGFRKTIPSGWRVTASSARSVSIPARKGIFIPD